MWPQSFRPQSFRPNLSLPLNTLDATPFPLDCEMNNCTHSNNLGDPVRPTRSLIILKLIAMATSGSFAASIPIEMKGSFWCVALFLASVICLWPRIGWAAPGLIAGFCTGPLFFASSINGGGAQDIRGAIIGATLGLFLGMVMDSGRLVQTTSDFSNSDEQSDGRCSISDDTEH